jgi:hypothetical protein
VPDFESSVFINCPFDAQFAPILQAIAFCVKAAGLEPRLATERANAAEIRLAKIKSLIWESKYSIHDLSRCQAKDADEISRFNMPFELGIDWACREYCGGHHAGKQFLILEEKPYRYQAALSDLAGCDIETHGADYQKAMTKVRHWLKQQAGLDAGPPAVLLAGYNNFQAWDYEIKLKQGYSEQDLKEIPMFERLESMGRWFQLGKPAG